MKDYINLLFSIIDNINEWELKDYKYKKEILKNYIYDDNNHENYVDYFDKYREFLTKNSFKNLSKDILTF